MIVTKMFHFFFFNHSFIHSVKCIVHCHNSVCVKNNIWIFDCLGFNTNSHFGN